MFVFNESTSDHQYDFLLFLNQTSSHPSLSKYRLFAFLLHFITVSLILVFLDVRCEMSLSVKYTAHFIRAWTGLKAKGGIFHYFLCLKEFYFWGEHPSTRRVRVRFMNNHQVFYDLLVTQMATSEYHFMIIYCFQSLANFAI